MLHWWQETHILSLWNIIKEQEQEDAISLGSLLALLRRSSLLLSTLSMTSRSLSFNLFCDSEINWYYYIIDVSLFS